MRLCFLHKISAHSCENPAVGAHIIKLAIERGDKATSFLAHCRLTALILELLKFNGKPPSGELQ
jgi:hypothetical protein